MSKARKVGICLIIIGVFIPSILYPFTSLTTTAAFMQVAIVNKGVPYKPRLNDLEVVFKKGDWIKDSDYQGHYEGRIAVPYHYALAIGITMVFLGISLIALYGKKGKKEDYMQ